MYDSVWFALFGSRQEISAFIKSYPEDFHKGKYLILGKGEVFKGKL